MEDYNEGLVIEQKELKEKVIKLVDFMNSEKFFKLSEKYRQVLINQKIGMDIYLNALNTRVFEDIEKANVPNLGFLGMFGSIMTNPFSSNVPDFKPLDAEEGAQFKSTGVDEMIYKVE